MSWRRRRFLIFLISTFHDAFFLLIIIELEVIKELSRRFEIYKDLQHFFSDFGINFLAVSSLTSWLIFIKWILNMDELSVWDIFDKYPLNIDRPWPLSIILFPKRLLLHVMLHSTFHLGYSAKVLGFIHTEE
jgi:hypothetical protein